MARQLSDSEPIIQILGYGTLTPTYSLIVHPWVHILAGNPNTLYVPPEACALVGTIISSEGIPLEFPPPHNQDPVQVDSIPDPPQPPKSSGTNKWSCLSNREILFLLQEDLVVNHEDIIELEATKIEQLCEKYHTLSTSETRSRASTYVDRGLQDSTPQYLQGLQKVLRAIDRSINQSIGECFLQTHQPMSTTEEPDSTVQDDCSEQHTQTRIDKPVELGQQVGHQ